MPGNTYARAVIANGAALSGAVDVGEGQGRMGLLLPAAWTAAALTFQVAAAQAGPFGNLYDDAGTEVTVASAQVVAGRAVSLATPQLANALAPWRFVKIRSGTAAAPVNQAAERIIEVVAEDD